MLLFYFQKRVIWLEKMIGYKIFLKIKLKKKRYNSFILIPIAAYFFTILTEYVFFIYKYEKQPSVVLRY